MSDKPLTPEGTQVPRMPTDRLSQLRILGQYPVDLEGEFPYLFLTLGVRVASESAASATLEFTKSPLPFLVAARDFLAVLLSAAFANGFVARIDVSGKIRAALDCQGTFVDFESEFAAMTRLTQFVATTRAERLEVYPINISLFRAAQPLAESFIELFRTLRFDKDIMRKMFDAGVVRIAIAERYGDLIASPDNSTEPLRWLDEVRRHFGERLLYGVYSL